MCSSPGTQEPSGAVAARLAKAIDELAAAVGDSDADGPELAARVAGAWAMISAADPELAARMARYSPS